MILFCHRHFSQLDTRELHDVLWLRDVVFVVGQQVTSEPEVDGLDPECVHIIGRERGGRVVATARIFLDESPVKVGRIAVHPERQRTGVGSQLMHYVHGVIGKRSAVMSAQDYLREWYGKLGWVVDSDVYMEAEIPHVRLVRPSQQTQSAT